MLRKIISVFLLLVILGGFVSVTSTQAIAATNLDAREQWCEDISGVSLNQIIRFLGDNIFVFAAFTTIDIGISFVQGIEWIGGVAQPLDQVTNFLRDIWMEALIWGTIASFFNWFAGSLIEAGIALNLALGADNSLISYGGRIILQIANLGLVISIIFIGIATILRLKKDELSADKLFIKLIISIILVNLTIPVVLSITDAGTRITDVMYRASSPCPVAITHQFTASSLHGNIQEMLRGEDSPPADSPQSGIVSPEAPTLSMWDIMIGGFQAIQDWGMNRVRQMTGFIVGILNELVISYLSLIISAAISMIAALTFFAFAIFLFIRYAALMVLITFSPLIWFGFIFSNLKLEGLGNIWLGWWAQFLKWTFFGPVIVLFLAFTSEYLYHSIEAERGGFIALAELIVVIMISAMGLYAASKFSGAGGKLVIQGVSGGVGFTANNLQGWAKKAQIRADMRAKEEGLKGNLGKEKAFQILSKAGQATSTGLSLSKSSSLLGQVGVKPVIKAPDEEKIKKDVLKEKTKELQYGKPKLGAGFGIGVGYQPSIAGVPLTNKPWKGISFGYIKDPTKTLAISEKDAQSLSGDDKKAFLSAIREVQKISYSLTPEELASLRKHEKTFASDLATATMKDVDAPATLTFGKAMAPNDLSKAKNMLQLSQESIRDIVNNGTMDAIEKGAKTILALESELMASPTSFNRAELGKLQILRRNFDEKIADYILDSIDPLTNPESVLNLSNKNLSYISKSSTTLDKQKIDESLTQLNFRRVGGRLDTTGEKELARVDTKINVYKGKHEW